MSDLSNFQTTSFHTRLSFLDEEHGDSLLEDDEEQEEEDDKFEDDYNNCGPSGNNQVCFDVLSPVGCICSNGVYLFYSRCLKRQV